MRRDRWLPGVAVRLCLLTAFSLSLTIGCSSIPPVREAGQGQLNPVTISSIKAARGEQGTEVIIVASRPFSYSFSNHESPTQVLIEIPGGKFAGLPPQIPINRGAIRAVTLREQDGVARVQIALDRHLNYQVRKEEGRLALIFQDPSLAEAPRKGWEKPPDGSESLNVPEYVIGETDVLEVLVYREQELSGNYRVMAEGEILVPWLGNVRVAGLTPSQVQQKLESLLRSGYIKNPQVYVTMKEYRSKRVAVLGAVGSPGSYQISGGLTTMLELLITAGGTNLEGGNKSLTLMRPDASGEMQSITIDVERLVKEGDTSLNMALQPNDMIYVTKADERSDSIVIVGAINSPGVYRIQGKGMTVMEALLKAGGFTKFAAPNRTRIMRTEGREEKAIQVRAGDLMAKGDRAKDVPLQAGDIIVVPEGIF